MSRKMTLSLMAAMLLLSSLFFVKLEFFPEDNSNSNALQGEDPNQEEDGIIKKEPVIPEPFEDREELDTYLNEWLKLGIIPENLKTTNGNPLVNVYASDPLDIDTVNSAMEIDSYVDLGGYYIILGSVEDANSLDKLITSSPNLKVASNPIIEQDEPNFDELRRIDQKSLADNHPDQNNVYEDVGLWEPWSNGVTGEGVTIAVVDGGIDFGNSVLESNLALDDNGLPLSFDTEGWSLVATPVEVGADIPVTVDETTIQFSQANKTIISSMLMTNDPFGIGSYEFWERDYGFTYPGDMGIDSTWINEPGQAPPMFGVGWQDWPYGEAGISWAYFYALVLDVDADGTYESAVIDVQSSAATCLGLYHNPNIYNGSEAGLGEIQTPEWNFTNDKVVSWTAGGGNTGSDFTFTADWNNDSINDWSFGSMANAYNRYGFLWQDEDLYGTIVNGVVPTGDGFVVLHPHDAGFGSHGTWAGSMAAADGSNGWAYGAAPDAELLSIAWGSAPQEALMAWFWAAGMNLVAEDMLGIEGRRWEYSGNLRAEITSNSWGLAQLSSGYDELDWLIDLMAMPSFGAPEQIKRGFNGAKVWDGSYFSDDWSYPFTDSPSAGKTFYVGSTTPFVGMEIYLSTSAWQFGSYVTEYWHQDEYWTSASTQITGSWIQTSTQLFNWTLPNDWGLTNVDGQEMYWIRFRLTGGTFSGSPVAEWIQLVFDNQFYGYPGMLMVTSAGNDGYYKGTGSAYGTLSLKVGASKTTYPYIYGIITHDMLAEFSSGGPKGDGVPNVDVLAPGYAVYSMAPLYSTCLFDYGGNAYTNWDGTSAAAPYAAGVAALAYEMYTNLHGSRPYPSYVKQVMMATSTNLYYPSELQGAGLLNGTALINYLNNTNNEHVVVGSEETFRNSYDAQPWYSGNLDLPYYEGGQNNLLLNHYLNSYELYTGPILKGSTYSTTFDTDGTSVTYGAKHLVENELIEPTIYPDVNDAYNLTSSDEYRLVLDLTNYHSNWDVDYLELNVGGPSWDMIWFAQLMLWNDTNNNGIPELSEIGEYGRTFGGQNFGMIKLGDPARAWFGNGKPVLVLVGDPGMVDVSSPSWGVGLSFDISIKRYTMQDMAGIWFSGNTINIDTSSYPWGYHHGWVTLSAGSTTQYMPLTVKVIESLVGTQNAPQMMGVFKLKQSTYLNGVGAPIDGTVVSIPFEVDHNNHEWDDVLVFRITSPNINHIGAFLSYDENPIGAGGYVIWHQDGMTGEDVSGLGGEDVLWYYHPWEQQNFYAFELGSGGTFNYRLGLYSQDLAGPFTDVTVEAYWLDSMPYYQAGFSDGSTGDWPGQVLQGPNFNLQFTLECTSSCDANLNGMVDLLYGYKQLLPTIGTSGEYENGVIGDASVDHWETREFTAGDYVEWTGGSDDWVDDSDVFYYFPSTAQMLGLPTNVPGSLPQPYDGIGATAEAVEYGSFIAPETGTYYFALDNWAGGSSGWFLETTVIRDPILYNAGAVTSYTINTQTHSSFGDEVESTFEWQTSSFNNPTYMTIQGSNPTNLFFEQTDVFFFDNWPAPVVEFDSTTQQSVDRAIFLRDDSPINVYWTVEDWDLPTNLMYTINLTSPSMPSGYAIGNYMLQQTVNAFEWDFSDSNIYPDGIWTIKIQAEFMDGYVHNLAGKSRPTYIVVYIGEDFTETAMTGQPTTVTVNVTETTSVDVTSTVTEVENTTAEATSTMTQVVTTTVQANLTTGTIDETTETTGTSETETGSTSETTDITTTTGDTNQTTDTNTTSIDNQTQSDSGGEVFTSTVSGFTVMTVLLELLVLPVVVIHYRRRKN